MSRTRGVPDVGTEVQRGADSGDRVEYGGGVEVRIVGFRNGESVIQDGQVRIDSPPIDFQLVADVGISKLIPSFGSQLMKRFDGDSQVVESIHTLRVPCRDTGGDVIG